MQPVGLLKPAELMFLVIRIMRHHVVLIASCVAIFAGLAVVYLLTTPAQYRATAVMIMDARRPPGLQAANTPETPLDNPTVESQAEVLRSESIALSVIRDLKLVDDPGFIRPSLMGSFFDLIGSITGSGEAPSDARKLRAVVEQFDRRLQVRRIGVTYVFEISFLHPDPDKAAEVANAVAEAYVVEQLESKYQSTRRAGVWLQDRLKELSKQANDAERAVIEFKQQNRIIDAGAGRLLNEQQLSELNSQMVLAGSAAGEARAKLDRIEAMVNGDVPDISVADMLRNEVIVRLRGQYLDLSKREVDLIPRVGVAHDSVQKIRGEMREIARSIKSELGRVAESYRSDYEIAKSRLENLQASMNLVINDTQLTNKAQVELRELDSAAQSYRALYDNFLQRYMEGVQQQSIPLTEARLVTQATAPLRKAEPRFLITMLGSIMVGFGVGFGAAWLREAADDRVRNREQLEALSGQPCICALPKLKIAGKAPADSDVITEVSRRPLSRFSEGIRTIKMSVDFHAPTSDAHKVIGLVSPLPGEGKSTISFSLAETIRRSGAKVIVVDADLRRPSLSARLTGGRKGEPGLVEVLSGLPFEKALVTTPDRPDLLPTAQNGPDARSNELLSSIAMTNLLRDLRAKYDYVIIDLPPLVPVIDARAISDQIDAFVMVVAWGQTPKDSVRQAYAMAARMENKIVGSVLNMVDESSEGYYGGYSGPTASQYYARS